MIATKRFKRKFYSGYTFFWTPWILPRLTILDNAVKIYFHSPRISFQDRKLEVIEASLVGHRDRQPRMIHQHGHHAVSFSSNGIKERSVACVILKKSNHNYVHIDHEKRFIPESRGPQERSWCHFKQLSHLLVTVARECVTTIPFHFSRAQLQYAFNSAK